MSFSPVKVAVVGVGALGEHHARIYSELPEASLVALIDLKEDRARRIAPLYGCQAGRDYREILDSVEAVSVVVPTGEHARIGKDCLERGVHVLVEKPISDSLPGADRLIEAQQKSGALLHVGHSERFNPAFRAVSDCVTEPQFFEAHRLGVFVARSLDIDVVLDLMIHDLDLIFHLVRSPVREMRAVGIPVLTERIDIASARLEFENGCVANVTASRVSHEKIRKLRFFQPHDYVSIDFHAQQTAVYSLVDSGSGKRIVQRSLDVRREEPLKLELQTFLRAVRGLQPLPGQPPGCSAQEGKAALGLALKVLSLARS